LIQNKELYITINDIENWPSFWKRAVAYTLNVLKFKYHVSSNKGLEGKTAEDFAEEVLEKLLTGERSWNKRLHPNFFSQVKSSIDSHINNYINSTKKTKEFPINEEITKSFSENTFDLKELYDYSIVILESLEATDEEIILFNCQVDGITKPREIAEELGITANEVYNIQKRLNRKLPELQHKIQSYGI